MTQRTCSIEGCAKTYRARGFCASHYNSTFYPDRHRRKSLVRCAWCGRDVEKAVTNNRSRQAVCSLRCRDSLRIGRQVSSKELVGPLPWTDPSPRPAPTWTGSEAKGPRRVFFQGDCAWCGEQFTRWAPHAGTPISTCSERCLRGVQKSRRGGFYISPVRRLALYERDAWTCQLCSAPVDPTLPRSDDWAPSLDHIECQSWALIPDHSDANLRLAHRWCNAVRGDGRYVPDGLFAA